MGTMHANPARSSKKLQNTSGMLELAPMFGEESHKVLFGPTVYTKNAI
jgi:hypothetical protein